MAELAAPLWKYNFRRVVVVDVSDDYRLMQSPMPTSCYPVLEETLLPVHGLYRHLGEAELVDGFLYDWHENPKNGSGPLYVGVGSQTLA